MYFFQHLLHLGLYYLSKVTKNVIFGLKLTENFGVTI